MNEVIYQLFNDDLIDKEKLLLKKAKVLGITTEQVILIINLLHHKKHCTIRQIAIDLNIEQQEAETLINELLELNFIKIDYHKKDMIFNFDLLWEKMIMLYLAPDQTNSMDEKTIWFINRLKIINEPIVFKTIKTWINNGGWKRMLSMVDGLTKLKADQSLEWKTIKKLYESEESNKKAQAEQLKQLSKANWLVD
ncbi:MAG: hypothetical protein GQ557_00075 [Mycoplasmataceae bacterium]|nr:hypothetical protein [Mycoplasmataceae bacterium]